MRFAYLAVLAGCLIGTLPLELVLHARVYARWRRWLLALVPTVVVFLGWDVYAISHRHWSFDRSQIVGWILPGAVPVEEVLFFLVIPTCALLTFEAVRRITGWSAGDERR